ncbi:hypothetical protein D3C87_1328140 [compost metagenome]
MDTGLDHDTTVIVILSVLASQVTAEAQAMTAQQTRLADTLDALVHRVTLDTVDDLGQRSIRQDLTMTAWSYQHRISAFWPELSSFAPDDLGRVLHVVEQDVVDVVATRGEGTVAESFRGILAIGTHYRELRADEGHDVFFVGHGVYLWLGL